MSSVAWLRQHTFMGARLCRRSHSRPGRTGRSPPYALKPVGDEAFVAGLNRMVFHQYTHQPVLDMKPGWQYDAGTHFDRNITWWEQARAFFQYLARCQYLLQQGTFVADTLYFYGEGVTKFVPSREYRASVASARL